MSCVSMKDTFIVIKIVPNLPSFDPVHNIIFFLRFINHRGWDKKKSNYANDK